MNKLLRYGKALAAYYRTPKARHDLFDYLRAALLMIAVMVLVRAVVELLK